MNKFLEKMKQGEVILFSELLEEIPPDDVLEELFPAIKHTKGPLITQRGLEVLKLRLAGLRQQEIAEKLGLTPGQVAHSSRVTKNRLYRDVPIYIDVDIPPLRKILGLAQKERKGYLLLSELLRDMPSDEALLELFTARGNLIVEGGKRPPTHQDLQLLQMRSQKMSYEDIGKAMNMEPDAVRHQVSLTLTRVRRDLKLALDVPALSALKTPSPEILEKANGRDLSVLSPRQRMVWVLRGQGLSQSEIGQRLGISTSAVAQHTALAERRFREYDRYCAAEERNLEPAFLPLTRGEVKIIIAALSIYEKALESGVTLNVKSDREGKLPYITKVVANLYDKAQIVIYGKPLNRLFPNLDKDQ